MKYYISLSVTYVSSLACDPRETFADAFVFFGIFKRSYSVILNVRLQLFSSDFHQRHRLYNVSDVHIIAEASHLNQQLLLLIALTAASSRTTRRVLSPKSRPDPSLIPGELSLRDVFKRDVQLPSKLIDPLLQIESGDVLQS